PRPPNQVIGAVEDLYPVDEGVTRVNDRIHAAIRRDGQCPRICRPGECVRGLAEDQLIGRADRKAERQLDGGTRREGLSERDHMKMAAGVPAPTADPDTTLKRPEPD